ncbi:MAG: thioesterase family protein [Thermoanaerobaculia bacterium]
MSSMLEDYPVVIEVPIAWGDMDAMRHVNNAVYFRWFESVRIAYFDEVGYLEHMRETGVGPILASTRCRFRMPLAYPDRVSAGARVSELGEDRFEMSYAVASHQTAKIAAEGDGLIVSFDYHHNRKAPLPAAIRRRIEALEATSS